MTQPKEHNELDDIFADGATDGSGLEIVAGQDGASSSAPSPYVIALDRWGKRKGKELVSEWEEVDQDDEAWETPELKEKAVVAADAHGSLFEPDPKPTQNPLDKDRAEWWKQLMASPEHQALRQQTCLDPALSSIGSKALLDQWTAYEATRPEPKEGDPEPGSDEEPLERSIARIKSTGKAVQQAAEAVEEAKAIGAGLGMGEDGHGLNPRDVAKYFQQVKENVTLLEIMAMAGRMRAFCQSLQRTKSKHGRDDVVGIELGGDVSRLIPSELCQLLSGVEELELVSLDRLARKQSMCRKYKGVERLAKGPIVVCVDESGSMRGEKIIAAKALALTLAWLARTQKRWIALVGFAGGTTGTRVAFKPGSMDQGRLIEWLSHFYGGGTTMDVPLAELPGTYWDEFVAQGLQTGKTDVVLITDAVVSVPDKMREKYLRWAKAQQVFTYGIVVGAQTAGDLGQVCDKHWLIPSLDMDSPAVSSVLSI